MSVPHPDEDSPSKVPVQSSERDETSGKKKSKRSSPPRGLGKNKIQKNKKNKIRCELVPCDKRMTLNNNERMVQLVLKLGPPDPHDLISPLVQGELGPAVQKAIILSKIIHRVNCLTADDRKGAKNLYHEMEIMIDDCRDEELDSITPLSRRHVTLAMMIITVEPGREDEMVEEFGQKLQNFINKANKNLVKKGNDLENLSKMYLEWFEVFETEGGSCLVLRVFCSYLDELQKSLSRMVFGSNSLAVKRITISQPHITLRRPGTDPWKLEEKMHRCPKGHWCSDCRVDVSRWIITHQQFIISGQTARQHPWKELFSSNLLAQTPLRTTNKEVLHAVLMKGIPDVTSGPSSPDGSDESDCPPPTLEPLLPDEIPAKGDPNETKSFGVAGDPVGGKIPLCQTTENIPYQRRCPPGAKPKEGELNCHCYECQDAFDEETRQQCARITAELKSRVGRDNRNICPKCVVTYANNNYGGIHRNSKGSFKRSLQDHNPTIDCADSVPTAEESSVKIDADVVIGLNDSVPLSKKVENTIKIRQELEDNVPVISFSDRPKHGSYWEAKEESIARAKEAAAMDSDDYKMGLDWDKFYEKGLKILKVIDNTTKNPTKPCSLLEKMSVEDSDTSSLSEPSSPDESTSCERPPPTKQGAPPSRNPCLMITALIPQDGGMMYKLQDDINKVKAGPYLKVQIKHSMKPSKTVKEFVDTVTSLSSFIHSTHMDDPTHLVSVPNIPDGKIAQAWSEDGMDISVTQITLNATNPDKFFPGRYNVKEDDEIEEGEIPPTPPNNIDAVPADPPPPTEKVDQPMEEDGNVHQEMDTDSGGRFVPIPDLHKDNV